MSDDAKLNAYIGVDELIEKIRKYHPDDDMELVRRAYAFAEHAHANQFRKSGDPYFCHPCAVAVILADLMLDATTIAAGLLHDCVEDVDGVTQVISEQFGQDVALLVDGVTKLTRQNFSSREEAQAETLRKMFLAMAKDIRVVLIKLADRLHNMRTLKSQRPERQVPIARETLDIYAPLAHRLGVYAVKWELEDLALRYIDPEAFYELVRLVGMKRDERERLVAEVTQELKSQLFSEGIRRCEIDGRPKHFYSIYRKMKTQHKTFDQIYDLIAVRVLVNTQAECYHVLGTVNNMWQPIPGRIKDYISQPSRTCTSRCTPPSSIRAWACRSRCRSAPSRCTASPNTASPPTGGTRRARRATNWTRSCRGCAACSTGRLTRAIRATSARC